VTQEQARQLLQPQPHPQPSAQQAPPAQQLVLERGFRHARVTVATTVLGTGALQNVLLLTSLVDQKTRAVISVRVMVFV